MPFGDTKTCAVPPGRRGFKAMRFAHMRNAERSLALPWGVGGFRNPLVFLEPGDTVEAEGVGVLSNQARRSTT
jgi:hypothetical protein